MGFGQLFIGYVLVSIFTLAPTYFITDLVGSFVMYEALTKLRRHAPKFKYAVFGVYILFAVSLVQCVYYALNYIGFIDSVTLIEQVIEICRLATMFFYTVSLLFAINELSLLVGDEKLAYKCRRNIWYYCISYFFIISLSLDFDFLEAYVSAFSAFAFLFRLVAAVLICINIYSAYMWICLEGDHDMDKKASKHSKVGDFMNKVKNGGNDDITKEDLKKLNEQGINKKK